MKVLYHYSLKSILLFALVLCFGIVTPVCGQTRSGFSFESAEDFAEYLDVPKRFQGSGPFFKGVIELRNDDGYSLYVNGKHLSDLFLVGRSQKFCYGDYVRMAVFVNGSTYPVVVHLPDSQHPYEYFYFEPIETSTNSNLASAFNLPVTKGWLWVEPDIQNGKATLIWHTDSRTKPSPIIYKRMR